MQMCLSSETACVSLSVFFDMEMITSMYLHAHFVGLLMRGGRTGVAGKINFTARPGRLASSLSASLLLLALGMPAKAEDPVDTSLTQSRFVLGAALMSSAEYSGSDRSDHKLSPLWAFQYSRPLRLQQLVSARR